MEYLIAAAFFGCLGGWLAKRKNRNPYKWGFFCALFPVLALVALAFQPYLCPKCGRKLSNAAGRKRECSTCGSF
jgi:hypothetical protein